VNKYYIKFTDSFQAFSQKYGKVIVILPTEMIVKFRFVDVLYAAKMTTTS